jgi:hypothetical protein
MRNPTFIRFASAAILILLACVGLLCHSVFLLAICLGINLFVVPRSYPDLSDAGMRRWLLGVAIKLVVLLSVVGLVWVHPPASSGTIERIIYHPAFVAIFGLVSLWSLLRGWRKWRGLAGA